MATKKSYVYMIGENDVSKEFKSKQEAIKQARKIASRTAEPVSLDHILSFPNGYSSQGWEGYVMPFKMSNKAKLKHIL